MANRNINERSVWTGRFTLAAIVQGFIITLILAGFGAAQFLGWLTPDFAHVMAAGNAGNWFTIGLFAYLIVGVVATAITGLYYQYLEVTLEKPINKAPFTYLAWIHLIFSNVGIFGASLLMMYGGYVAGGNMLPASEGGLGWNAGQAHTQVLGTLVDPITLFIGILTFGIIVGGLSYISRWLFNGWPFETPASYTVKND